MASAAKTTPASAAAEGSLSNSAAAVLGMLALGARSGYEIRRAAELSVRFFWALGPPQIYAELNDMEKAGLIDGQDDSQGRRPRRRYELTARGRSALRQWVRSHRPAPLELRDPVMLQLFFADVVDPADVTALLRRIRDRSVQALAMFDDQILPAAAKTEDRGYGQPKVVAEFGMALHRFIVDWCEERLDDG
jgi:DNA-binding PadR family transcriptional regulator